MTDTAETAADLNLDDALREVFSSADGFSRAFFTRLAREVYLDSKRRDRLSELLEAWDPIAQAASSVGSAEVIRGYLLFVRGEFEAAAEVLSKEKSDPWGMFFGVQACLALRRSDDAAALVKGASANAAPVAYAKARVLLDQGKEDEALQLVDGLDGSESETPDHQFTRGLCLEEAGEYRDAIEAYRGSVRRDDQFADGWFRLGYLLDLYGTEEEEDADEAVKAYEACLDLIPLHTNAVVNLGLIYEDRERYHDAAKCYETVLKAYPNHSRARLYLGDAIAATQMFYDRDQEKKADRHSQILKIPVTDFELSVRSRNCLQKMNIDTLGDLIMKTEQELLSYKNFGETSLKEIKEMLTQKGLRLGQGLEEKGREPPSGRNPLEATAPAETLDKPIDELNLSVRSRRCMERLEVRSVRDLINKTEVELMSAKNFGMTSLNEIKRKLAELNLSLRS